MAAILGQMAVAILVGMLVLVAVWALGPAWGDAMDRPSQMACQDALDRRYDAQTRIWRTGSDAYREENLKARTDIAIADRDITSSCYDLRAPSPR